MTFFRNETSSHGKGFNAYPNRGGYNNNRSSSRDNSASRRPFGSNLNSAGGSGFGHYKKNEVEPNYNVAKTDFGSPPIEFSGRGRSLTPNSSRSRQPSVQNPGSYYRNSGFQGTKDDANKNTPAKSHQSNLDLNSEWVSEDAKAKQMMRETLNESTQKFGKQDQIVLLEDIPQFDIQSNAQATTFSHNNPTVDANGKEWGKGGSNFLNFMGNRHGSVDSGIGSPKLDGKRMNYEVNQATWPRFVNTGYSEGQKPKFTDPASGMKPLGGTTVNSQSNASVASGFPIASRQLTDYGQTVESSTPTVEPIVDREKDDFGQVITKNPVDSVNLVNNPAAANMQSEVGQRTACSNNSTLINVTSGPVNENNDNRTIRVIHDYSSHMLMPQASHHPLVPSAMASSSTSSSNASPSSKKIDGSFSKDELFVVKEAFKGIADSIQKFNVVLGSLLEKN